MRVLSVVGLLLVTTAFGGCASTDGSGGTSSAGNPDAVAAYQAARHPLITNQNFAVSASSTDYWSPVQLPREGSLEVSWGITDNSRGLDWAIIAASDAAEYADGASVTQYSGERFVTRASQTVPLPQGSYALAFYCHNDFADCDLQISLTAVY